MPELSTVKIDNGLYIDETRINGLVDVDIKSNVDNVSEVTIKLYCKIEGLDNIVEPEPYKFENVATMKSYQPNRKYRSR